MFSRVVNTTPLTPFPPLSKPGNASPSPPPSQSLIPHRLLHQSTTPAPPQASASVPPHAPFGTPPPPPPSPGAVEILMHKTVLNCYCQRLGIPLPVYQTASGGCGHAMRFRSTVSVGEKTFASPNIFGTRKSAEQDAAKIALQHLQNGDEASATNLDVDLRKLVFQDKPRCKMIINEFQAKMRMECAYMTVQVETPPVFVSSLVLNGTCYRGEGGKNKKEAEQLAAVAAILSLLDDPTYATPISKVIKSNCNTGPVFNELKDFPTGNKFKTTTFNSDAMPLTQQASSIGQSSFRVFNEKMPTSVALQGNMIEEQRGKQDLLTSLSQTENQGGQGVLVDEQGVAGHRTEAVTISRCSYVHLPRTSPFFSKPQHEFKLPEAAQPASRQIRVPIEYVPPPAHNLAYDSSSSKRRGNSLQNANEIAS